MRIRRVLVATLAIGAGFIGTVFAANGLRLAHAQDGNHGGHHHRHGGRLIHFCQEGVSDKLDRMSARLTTELELTPEQQANLEAIAQTIKSNDFQSSCPTEDRVASATPLDKLDYMETRLETGLSMVRQVRQPVETFYNSLTIEQQEELSTLMSRHRHH